MCGTPSLTGVQPFWTHETFFFTHDFSAPFFSPPTLSSVAPFEITEPLYARFGFHPFIRALQRAQYLKRFKTFSTVLGPRNERARLSFPFHIFLDILCVSRADDVPSSALNAFPAEKFPLESIGFSPQFLFFPPLCWVSRFDFRLFLFYSFLCVVFKRISTILFEIVEFKFDQFHFFRCNFKFSNLYYWLIWSLQS